MFDSFNNANQIHEATWQQTDILPKFLKLVGSYHTPF